MTKIYNFSAGPAMLPVEVMAKAQQDFISWNKMGVSIMEMSHRSEAFIDVAGEAEKDLRDLMSIPSNYKVLFLQGGGRGQFAAVPLNISTAEQSASIAVSGQWSSAAAKEARKYLTVKPQNVVIEDDGQKSILPFERWNIDQESAYFHFCPNETVDGIAISGLPDTEIPIVADLSSSILSDVIDVSKYGVIFASAQKNIGPSGLVIAIVRDDLIGQARNETPSIFDYAIQSDKESMYNTPPTFAWYLSGLVFKWLKEQGGISAISALNTEKAALLYDFIDSSGFYRNNIAAHNRSKMNVPFYLANESLNAEFLAQADEVGLKALKGHRLVGGMRASIYNAMPLAGIEALVSFMECFEKNNS